MDEYNKYKKHKSKILLSPFIDLTFLLLVVFIISTMNMQDVKNIPIIMPSAQTIETTANETIIISITKDGKYYLDDKEMSLKELMVHLKNEQKPILIRGDKDADYKYIIELIDILRKNNITKFGLMTKFH